MGNILCYVRPWNKKQFNSIVNNACKSQSIVYVSDFSKEDDSGLYEVNKEYTNSRTLNVLIQDNSDLAFPLSDNEIIDIIARCRLLRVLPEAGAKKLVLSMWLSLDKIFAKYLPEIGIGLTIDSYVIDLINLRFSKGNKQYIGLIVSFVNGYTRITSRGEYKKIRNVSNKEVSDVLEKLTTKYQRPHFVKPISGKNQIRYLSLKNYLKILTRFGYYFIKSFFDEDRSNYHYKVNLNKNNLLVNPFEFLSAKIEFEINSSDPATKIYIPLQYFPEATVDYWVEDIKFINYFTVFFELLDLISELNVYVYVKEHPACIGIRPRGFYKKIKEYKNVNLVTVDSDPLEIIKSTDLTLVWTGTAGFEAALNGKPVIHLGNPYYASGSSKRFYYLENIKDISKALSWANSLEDMTYECKFSLVQRLLEGLVSGEFRQPVKRKGNWEFNRRDMEKVGDSISSLFEKIE